MSIHVQRPDGHVLTWLDKLMILNRAECYKIGSFLSEFKLKYFGVEPKPLNKIEPLELL